MRWEEVTKLVQIEVGFIGCDSIDLMFYFARVFRATGRTVAVVSNTNQLSALCTNILPEGLSEGKGYYKDILIVNDIEQNQKDISNQEVLIYQWEDRLYRKNEIGNGWLILIYVTDMFLCNAKSFTKLELPECVKEYLIIKNYVPMKYEADYLVHIMEKELEEIQIAMIPYDEMNEKTKCYLCMDKKHTLMNLSKEMKQAVLNILMDILEVQYSRKEQMALFKRA